MDCQTPVSEARVRPLLTRLFPAAPPLVVPMAAAASAAVAAGRAVAWGLFPACVLHQEKKRKQRMQVSSPCKLWQEQEYNSFHSPLK